MRLKSVVGDATRPEGDGPKVLVHVCDDLGLWGAGFAKAVSKRWKGPERDYRAACKAGELKLGVARFVEAEPGLTVASLVARRGVRRVQLRPEALREALGAAARYAREKKASVHMPRIERWKDVERILRDTLRGLRVTVYDLA
jgi:hypothetical protein